jgi:hypothetical protein
LDVLKQRGVGGEELMIFKLFKADKAGLCDVAAENGFGADEENVP